MQFIGILSPPGAFLTPSPSPTVSASPRLQPSPCLSPFPQDVLLVAGNHLTGNCTREQVIKERFDRRITESKKTKKEQKIEQ